MKSEITTNKVNLLLQSEKKISLANKLGIARMTLYRKLKTNNWNKLEIEKINKL